MQIISTKILTPVKTFQNQQPVRTNRSLPLKFSCDTVNFTGKDLLKLTDNEIFEKIKEAKNNSNFLGDGRHAKVFRIPETSYCLRLAKIDEETNFKHILDKNINEQDKVNHIVAKFGKDSSIMHYIEGSPVYNYYMRKDKAIDLSTKIAKMPHKSFRDFIYQIYDAYNKGMMFDCYWANVIANPKENKLTAIDFNLNKDEESLRTLSYSYSALVHEHTPVEVKKQIASKIFEVGVDELSGTSKSGLNPSSFDFSTFIRTLKNSKVIQDDTYLNIFKKTLNELVDLKHSQLRTQQDFSKEITGKIKVLKTLIKQIIKT